MRNLRIFLIIFTTITLFSSCEELENHGLTANAGPDQEASVGVPVTLNSQASMDLNGGGYMVLWNFESIPDGSSSSISNPGSENASFVPDTEGVYEVRLTISNDIGQSSDVVVISAIASGSVEIGGQYYEPLHLTNIIDDPDVPDYIVTDNLTMNAELTIDAGVRIGVGSDKTIIIGSSGVIKAMGASQQPIIITGTTELPGFWKGIRIESNNLENEINYMEVSSAGSNTISTGRPKTALHLESARLTISNSSFFDNDGYGISSRSSDNRLVMDNNRLYNNALGAMYISAGQIRDIDSNTDFGDQDVLISFYDLSLGVVHTWPSLLNGRYRFTDNINISDEVTIEAGAELLFDNDVLIRFRNNSIIKVLGTENDPVVFRGSLELAGSWKGVVVESSNLENKIQHTHFKHAGQNNLQTGFGKAAIGLASNARVEISDCEFSEIDGFGIYIRYDNTTLSFSNNTFHNSLSEGAVRLHTTHLASLDNTSDFGGNVVTVNGGDLADTDDVVWPALNNGSYFFISSTNIRGKITIEPGARLTFDNDILFRVYGVVNASGNSNNLIVFTKPDGSASHWKGIMIDSSSQENVLDYVEISYAGNSNLQSGLGQTNLGMSSSAYLTLTNSSITNSLGHGIYLRSGATLNESGNSFSDIAQDDIHNP